MNQKDPNWPGTV